MFVHQLQLGQVIVLFSAILDNQLSVSTGDTDI